MGEELLLFCFSVQCVVEGVVRLVQIGRLRHTFWYCLLRIVVNQRTTHLLSCSDPTLMKTKYASLVCCCGVCHSPFNFRPHSRSLPLTPAHSRSLPLTPAHSRSLPLTSHVLMHRYLRDNDENQSCKLKKSQSGARSRISIRNHAT